MKHVIFSILVFFLVGNHSAALSQTIEGNIDDIARALMTYFPKASGKVTSVIDQKLEIEIAPFQGLAEGVLLNVFREGEAFRHPVTGIPLGRFEGEVGIIEVTHAEAEHLTAAHIGATKKIEVGDLIRLPSTRIAVAITTRSAAYPVFLINELTAALNDTGRFQVDVLPAESEIKEALQRKNRYYLLLTTGQNGERLSMNLQLQNTVTGKELANLTILIRKSEESDLILEHLQYQLFEQRQKKQ